MQLSRRRTIWCDVEEEAQNKEFLEWIAVYLEIFFKMMETIAR